eukprot:TRINITY_DN7302_c0_g1_i1.p1 TRINITY_DN7302_c0_g1~~TRINITY_DN7302_c0_g1_i1.p1  ORF type:complete len:324 (-),score=97.96 TRINITY_DN7302_c0_g1_i1:331-1302(-)
MDVLGGATLNTRLYLPDFTRDYPSRSRKNDCPALRLFCCSCSPKLSAPSSVFHGVSPRRSVVAMGKKVSKNEENSWLFEEPYGPFPEAVLLRKKDKTNMESGPEFADVKDEELLTALELELESAMENQQARHYEIMYLIHERHASEVQNVVTKINSFIGERKGKIWRFNDWGMRNLAYKIKKAKKANYVLMNIEIQAAHINALKDLLDKDKRIIRHLVIKEEKAIMQDCPPPPEVYSVDDADISNLFDDDDDDEFEEELQLQLESDVGTDFDDEEEDRFGEGQEESDEEEDRFSEGREEPEEEAVQLKKSKSKGDAMKEFIPR